MLDQKWLLFVVCLCHCVQIQFTTDEIIQPTEEVERRGAGRKVSSQRVFQRI